MGNKKAYASTTNTAVLELVLFLVLLLLIRLVYLTNDKLYSVSHMTYVCMVSAQTVMTEPFLWILPSSFPSKISTMQMMLIHIYISLPVAMQGQIVST